MVCINACSVASYHFLLANSLSSEVLHMAGLLLLLYREKCIEKPVLSLQYLAEAPTIITSSKWWHAHSQGLLYDEQTNNNSRRILNTKYLSTREVPNIHFPIVYSYIIHLQRKDNLLTRTKWLSLVCPFVQRFQCNLVAHRMLTNEHTIMTILYCMLTQFVLKTMLSWLFM